MFSHTDRTNSRTTTTVRNCEGLMKIQVTNVCPDITRTCESNLRIHIRTIHIDLSAVIVCQLCNFFDIRIEESISRRISDHHC
ncbi:hypothetical protein D3C86_1417320 [compost metagenome]